MASLTDEVVAAGKYSGSPTVARPHAVAAALEVIAALAASGTPINLQAEIDNLSAYADKIQEALKVKTE